MKIESPGVVLLGPPMLVIERPKRGGIYVADPCLALADEAIGLLEPPALPGGNCEAWKIVVVLRVVVRAADKTAGV